MSDQHTTFLPIISISQSMPQIGATFDQNPPINLSYQLDNVSPNGYIMYHIWWCLCEAQQGQIVWPYFMTSFLDKIPPHRFVMVSVKAAPAWARYPGSCECSRVHPDFIGAYSRFVAELVKRFPVIRAVEVWNEPAVKESPGAKGIYGCLMAEAQNYVPDDFFAVGRDVYAPLVASAINALSAAGKADIMVVAGALGHRDNVPFLQGALSTGIRPYAVSWHWYPVYPSGPAQWEIDLTLHLDAMRSVAHRYPWILSETNYLNTTGTENAGHRDLQAEYIRWIAAQVKSRYELAACSIYTLQDNTWQRCALIQDGVYYPGYYAYLSEAI